MLAYNALENIANNLLQGQHPPGPPSVDCASVYISGYSQQQLGTVLDCNTLENIPNNLLQGQQPPRPPSIDCEINI
jgi:hypothetical protein